MAQFYAVQTSSNQERSVVNHIISEGVAGVYAALAPDTMNTYVIVEAEERRLVQEAIEGSYYAKKVLPGETRWSEVAGFLTTEEEAIQVGEGDTVVIQSGGYEGDLAVVQRVDRNNRKLRVELKDSPVAIPIDVPVDEVQVYD